MEKISTGRALHIESEYLDSSNLSDTCNEEKAGCICYYVYKYTNGTFIPNNTKFTYGNRNNCKISRVTLTRGVSSATINNILSGNTGSYVYSYDSNTGSWHNYIVYIRCGMTIECDLPSDIYTG